MEKKVAVVVRDRQEEALRMAVGLLLLRDSADVFVLDRKLEETVKNRQRIKMAIDLEMNLYTNCSQNSDFRLLSIEEIAARLSEYDTVLAY